MSIRDALQLKAVTVTIPSGLEVILRRPSTMDLLAAMEQSKDKPQTFSAWLVHNHLIDNGNKVFYSVDEVMGCDVLLINEIAVEIEKLYGEGKN
jgi:hypothetical protein